MELHLFGVVEQLAKYKVLLGFGEMRENMKLVRSISTPNFISV